MTEARILLGVSATLQGTVALTFGLAFFGLWRGFGRRAALRWTIAWMVYGVGVLNTAAGLAFGFGNRWPTLGQAFLSMPLLIGVLLFRTGTEVVADPERAPIDAGLVATVARVTVLVVVARLAAAAGWAGISPAMVNYVLPRLIMGGAYPWAFGPLARMAAPRSRQGITLLGYALVLLALRMFLAAAYEPLQMARGLPQQPESLPLTIAQLSLLIVFGVATAVGLIDAEREAEVRLEAALLRAQRLDDLWAS